MSQEPGGINPFNSQKRDKFKTQWDEYIKRTGTFADADTWQLNFIETPAIFWSQMEAEVPELAPVGIIVNSYVCQASECERLWSSCGRTNTKFRNRLCIGKLSAIEQVKFHLRKRSLAGTTLLKLLDREDSIEVLFGAPDDDTSEDSSMEENVVTTGSSAVRTDGDDELPSNVFKAGLDYEESIEEVGNDLGIVISGDEKSVEALESATSCVFRALNCQ